MPSIAEAIEKFRAISFTAEQRALMTQVNMVLRELRSLATITDENEAHEKVSTVRTQLLTMFFNRIFSEAPKEALLALCEKYPANDVDLFKMSDEDETVFLPSGYVFGKEWLTQHISTHGYNNPFNRQEFSEQDRAIISAITGIDEHHSPHQHDERLDLTREALEALRAAPPQPAPFRGPDIRLGLYDGHIPQRRPWPRPSFADLPLPQVREEALGFRFRHQPIFNTNEFFELIRDALHHTQETAPLPLSATETGYGPQPAASPALLLETQRTPQIASATESMEEQQRSGFFAGPRLFAPQRNAAATYHIINNLYFKIELRDRPLLSMTHNLHVIVNGREENHMGLEPGSLRLIRDNINNLYELKNIFRNMSGSTTAREILSSLIDAERETGPRPTP